MGLLARGHVVSAESRGWLLGYSLRSVIPVLAFCSLAFILLCSSRFSGAKARNRSWTCPIQFDRPTYEEIGSQTHKPYLLGGVQRPRCRNCHSDHGYADFCQFKTGGPVCNEWDQKRLLEIFLDRAELGAPGAKDLLTMTPCDLFQLLEGRTLWIVGDSLSQELSRATQCFLFEFWDLETHDIIGANTSFTRRNLVPPPVVPPGEAIGWHMPLMRNTNVKFVRGNYGVHLSRDILPQLPDLGALPSDIVLFNFGAWHNDDATYASNVSSLVTYLLEHRAKLPYLIWRDTSPQHFNTPMGEFGCEGCSPPELPWKCQPIEGVSLDAQNNVVVTNSSRQVVAEGGWRNRVMRPLMRQLGIPMVELWNQSVPLFGQNYVGPHGMTDCTHYCHPSSYQLWVYLFYEQLAREKANLPPIPVRDAEPKGSRRCKESD